MKFSPGELSQFLGNLAGATAKSPETAIASDKAAGQAQNMQASELINMMKSAMGEGDGGGRKAVKAPMFLDPNVVLAIDESFAKRDRDKAENKRANKLMGLEEKKVGLQEQQIAQQDRQMQQQQGQFDAEMQQEKDMFKLGTAHDISMEGVRFENEENILKRQLEAHALEGKANRDLELELTELANANRLAAARISSSGSKDDGKRFFPFVGKGGVPLVTVLNPDGTSTVAMPGNMEELKIMGMLVDEETKTMPPEAKKAFDDLYSKATKPDYLITPADATAFKALNIAFPEETRLLEMYMEDHMKALSGASPGGVSAEVDAVFNPATGQLERKQ